MESNKPIEPKLFRKRDFSVLAIILVALYLSYNSNNISYSFEPAWFIDQRKTGWTGLWALVPPVITDLDGNGENEIVLITRNLMLQIISATRPVVSKNEVYEPEVIASLVLSPLNIETGRAPVALKAGYVTPYNPIVERQQAIVVVREDWTVTCYDSNLNFVWEKAIAHKSHELDRLINFYKIEEVSVYLAPLSIKEGSSGIVVVGASMTLRDPNSLDQVIAEEGLSSIGKSDAERELAANMRASLEHFSIYALDAATGHILWKHDGSDVRTEQYIRSLPQHAFHLDLHDLTIKASHHAPGFNDWSLFRQSLLAELPHSWRVREDTNFRIAHFVRRHMGAGSTSQWEKETAAGKESPNKRSKNSADGSLKKTLTATVRKPNPNPNPKTAKSRDLGRFIGIETPPLSEGALLPHDASEHTEHPNVLVAHTKRGVEVISLRTGVPITALALDQGKAFGDIDGDGVVDTLLLLESPKDVATHGEAFANEGTQMHHCSMMVVSGLPPRSQLFNGTICQTRRHLHDTIDAPGANIRYSSIPVAISAAPPLIMRTVDQKTQLEGTHRDVVVAVNTGVVTSYNGKSGDFHWQVSGAPKWELKFEFSTALLFDSDAYRVEDLGQHDNMYAEIFVMGDTDMALLSREGELLISTELPNTPVSRPVFGDFDNDGITDVIIATRDALLGYRVEVVQSTPALFIAICVLCVITAITFVSNIRKHEVSLGSATSPTNAAAATQSRANLPASKRGLARFLSITRATDEFHLD